MNPGCNFIRSIKHFSSFDLHPIHLHDDEDDYRNFDFIKWNGKLRSPPGLLVMSNVLLYFNISPGIR